MSITTNTNNTHSTSLLILTSESIGKKMLDTATEVILQGDHTHSNPQAYIRLPSDGVVHMFLINLINTSIISPEFNLETAT